MCTFSILTYNIQVWDDVSNLNMKKLESFQNKCLRQSLSLRPNPVTYRQITTQKSYICCIIKPPWWTMPQESKISPNSEIQFLKARKIDFLFPITTIKDQLKANHSSLTITFHKINFILHFSCILYCINVIYLSNPFSFIFSFIEINRK